MKYLIYARVSPKGSGWGGGETTIPDQVADCKRYCTARDPDATFTVVSDKLLSGGTTERPGYQQIATQLASGVAPWDVLVVRHLDRMWRSVADGADLLRQLAAQGKGFVAIAQGFDFASVAGRLQIHILLAVAEYERAIGQERTRYKMRAICEAGGWPPGHTPFGYKRPGPKQNILVPDPKPAQIVRDLYTAYNSGTAPTALARERGLPLNTIWNILRNPIYIGQIRYGGTDYPGKHLPLVDRATWDAAQRQLGASGRYQPRIRAQRYPYLLAGLLKCGKCGHTMTPYSAIGRNHRKYVYYQCTGLDCPARVPAADIETAVADFILHYHSTPAQRAKLRAEYTRRWQTAITRDRPELKQLQTTIDKHTRDITGLVAALAAGKVDTDNRDMINAHLRTSRQAQALAQQRLEALQAAILTPDSAYARALAAIDAMSDIRVVLLGTDATAKAYALAKVLSAVEWTTSTLAIRLASDPGCFDQADPMASPRGVGLNVGDGVRLVV
jgi:DNA invertase Pin-like site-specific DNA recombinase/alkylhydroperoxidase/carboxymuconolactone decarboxylase family protein YurZ